MPSKVAKILSSISKSEETKIKIKNPNSLSRYRFFSKGLNKDYNKESVLMAKYSKENFRTNEDLEFEISGDYAHRPDLISKLFYGDWRLHWIITVANNFERPPKDYEVGKIIRIPNKNRITNYI